MNGWLELVGQVEEAKKDLDCLNGECWFRGHSNSTWMLAPGLFRPFIARNSGRPWKSVSAKAREAMAKELWELEADIFWEASTRAPDLQEHGITGWEILFKMQHYLFPTRLLDWTEVLGVAAYFALSAIDSYSAEQATPAIWVLAPYRLNLDAWGCKEIIDPRNLGWDDEDEEHYDYRDYITEPLQDDYSELPVAIYPAQNTFRMGAQSGRFTIHGRAIDGLENLYPESVKKIVIPDHAIPDIRKVLDFTGVFEHVLFPDLDGMSGSIRGRYGFAVKRR